MINRQFSRGAAWCVPAHLIPPYTMSRFLLVACILLLAVQGCGYRLGMPPRADLTGLRTLMFPTCRDRGRADELAVILTEAGRRIFTSEGGFELVDFERADARVECTVLETGFSAGSFRSGTDRVEIGRYRLTVKARFTLFDQMSGDPLSGPLEISEHEDVLAARRIPQVENNRALAARKLADRLMREAYRRLFVDW